MRVLARLADRQLVVVRYWRETNIALGNMRLARVVLSVLEVRCILNGGYANGGL